MITFTEAQLAKIARIKTLDTPFCYEGLKVFIDINKEEVENFETLDGNPVYNWFYSYTDETEETVESDIFMSLEELLVELVVEEATNWHEFQLVMENWIKLPDKTDEEILDIILSDILKD